MLYPFSFLQETGLLYLLLGILATMASLPFIYTDISIKTSGITRPITERTEIRSIISGMIDSLFYTEGERVQKNATILRIKDLTTKNIQTRNQLEIKQREQFIHDLVVLTSDTVISSSLVDQLNSPLFKEQASRFIHQKTEHEASLKKANREIEIHAALAKEKIISPKEFFDIQINQEKIQSSYHAFIQEQVSVWLQELAKYRSELSQYQLQKQQVSIDAGYYQITAPVSGIIQGMNTRYNGGLLQANELLCTISPEEAIIGECYVQSKDVGLLKKGQIVRYQLEAYNYNYFGILTGKIISIDNDFTVLENKPVFKVRCSFDKHQLHLKNGFAGQLKKGLGFQASFVVTRRSLWELLFDKLDDWLNPNAPSNNLTASQ
jgi:multidrug resistance efflux pump